MGWLIAFFVGVMIWKVGIRMALMGLFLWLAYLGVQPNRRR